jgi:DNA ligase-1
MEQDGNKYRSVSGQKDGAKVESGWTDVQGKNIGKKNETSPEDQATSDIKNKYKKQLKSGGYWENESDIDQKRYFECMLAKNYDDYKAKIDWKKGVGVQIKYNGARCIATKDGLFTRKGERFISVPHIEGALIPFFLKFPDAVLDGELFNWDLRQNLKELISLVNKKVHVSPQDLDESKVKVRYYVYDGFGFGAEQTDGYQARKRTIDYAFFNPKFAWRYKDVLEQVPTWVVHSEADLNFRYEKFLFDKQEGAIVRLPDVPYENKRSKYLLKYKPVDDAEYRVIKVNEGKVKGKCETVTCQRIDGQKFLDGTDTFDANFKGTDEEAEAFLKDHQWVINKVGTIYFNGYTGFGKPNYAQFDINNFDKGNV